LKGLGAVADLVFLLWWNFRGGFSEGRNQEVRVVAKPVGSPWSVDDGSFDGSIFVEDDSIGSGKDHDTYKSCDVDMNFVMLDNARIVEMQGTAEGESFSPDDTQQMLGRASKAIEYIMTLQQKAITEASG